METIRRHSWLLLVLGALLLVASQMRFGLGTLAWLAPIPILHYLRLNERARSRALAVGVLVLAWILAVAKIVTTPLTPMAAVAFGIPMGLMLGLPYVLWAALRPRVGDALAAPGFAALMCVSEWLLHVVLPLGTWGSAGNTQLDHLALMQLASVTGLAGVSFLVYWMAAVAETWLTDRSQWRQVALALVVIALVSAGGELRLSLAADRGHDVVRTAAIDSDATFGGLPLPTPAELERINAGLFARTHLAAQSGARIVVWPEGATLTVPQSQEVWRARLSELARREHVYLVAAYIVPITLEPLRYQNEYAFFTPEGRLDHVYFKHHPVPGEPAVPGHEPLPLVISPELGRISGAICYDYDFPRLGLDHAALATDLVVLPSSDWRGIDPIHTQMAAARAIEGGHSVLRATRLGLSAGIDPYGRLRGWRSHFEGGPRTLIVDLPRHGTTTIYGVLGDWFPAACGAYALGMVALALRARSRRAALAT